MIITKTAPRRTHGTLARTLFAGVAFTAITTSAFAEDAKINEAVFDAQNALLASITVRGDGEKWTTIVPGHTSFGARIKIDTKKPGYVERVGVWLGQCNGSECGAGGFKNVLQETPMARDYDVDRSISFPAEDLTNARAGATTYGKIILNRCNTKPYTEPHSFQLTVDASMSANTRKATSMDTGATPVEYGTPFDGGDVTRHDTFEITVKCLSTRNNDTAERKPNPKRTKPEISDDIDLFLSTYQSVQSDPRGTTCKPLKVTTRIETGEAGPMNVKLWRQVNGGPITSETKVMDADPLGGGKFGDDWNKFEHFTQTTTVQYKAEILDGTFAPSTPWKSITIHCNGNYAPTPPTSTNPDNGIPPRGRPQAELPPVIVTPPPACGTKAAKVRGSAPCIKVAPVPDQRQQWADQKREQAAEEKRKAAKEAKQRRREAAAKEAEMERRQMIHRPVGFGGRFGGPGRFGGNPMVRPGFVVRPGLIINR